MSTFLVVTSIFTLLYTFFVSGRLVQTEKKLAATMTALDRHLRTGGTYLNAANDGGSA